MRPLLLTGVLLLFALVAAELAVGDGVGCVLIDDVCLCGIHAGDNKACAICWSSVCDSDCSRCHIVSSTSAYDYNSWYVNFHDGYKTASTYTTQINRTLFLCTSNTIDWYDANDCLGEVDHSEMIINSTDRWLSCTQSNWIPSCAGIPTASICPY